MNPTVLKLLQATINAASKSKVLRYFLIGLAIFIVCLCSYGASSVILVTTVDQVSTASVSKSLISFIEIHEGYFATRYRGLDYQNETIGYGHVIEPGETYTYLTQPQAEALLIHDLPVYITSVQKEFAGTKLTQGQFDSLVDLAYNLGPYIWSKLNLTKDIKAGASLDVIHQDFDRLDFVNGKEAKGLHNRREYDFAMYASSIYDGVNGNVPH